MDSAACRLPSRIAGTAAVKYFSRDFLPESKYFSRDYLAYAAYFSSEFFGFIRSAGKGGFFAKDVGEAETVFFLYLRPQNAPDSLNAP